MKVKKALEYLKSCADRMIRKGELYLTNADAENQMDCIDIVTVKLNDFTQVFKDIVCFLRISENSLRVSKPSLRYYIASYDTFGFKTTSEEKDFLKELLLRNEITHDYFNRDLHQQKLMWMMEHCITGALDIYHNLNQYCMKRELLEELMDKNQ